MGDLLRSGWHPSGEKQISRATWKKDMKNLVSRKDEDATRAKDHVSTPLDSLKDPDSFGPPPKHTAYYPNAQATRSSTPKHAATTSTNIGLGAPVPPARSGTSTGLGGPVLVTGRADVQSEEEEQRPAPGPYRVNTTGLRTDHLPKPPGRNDGGQTPASTSPAVSRPVPALPTANATRQVPALPSPNLAVGRPVPAVPPRQAGPPPVLPPRQSGTPTEYTPPAPPSYGEAMRAPQGPSALNTGALNRLGQAGVSVPGFGISPSPRSPSAASHSGQLSELQQRFARMNNSDSTSSSPTSAVPSWKQAQALHSAASSNPAAVAGINSAVSAASAGSPSSPSTPTWKQAQALHSAATSHPAASAGIQSAFNAASQKKKPPPPVKKAGLSEVHAEADTSGPPPIPMLSKPRPG
ncbi:hypothetical protein AMS68_001941 [Peltaster fructicola]|uniref:Uncharacterized protein n=1 Tax=Peltaster fructicola TaxID=286661 RepID=A0A6H0XNX2_9PEZI|nr:hypothetical protein AMS68_001941 [Peltaster fructicola]